jgi:hypothetical protein
MKFLRLIFLCTFFTNIFCMRMTEVEKKYMQKYIQQRQQREIREREQKLKTAIVPYWSYKQVPPTNPVVFYEPKTKKMSLYFVENNQLKDTPISPTQISSYNFSPQKKYLIFQTTTLNMVKPAISWTEALKIQIYEKITGYKMGEKTDSPTNITKIVNLQTLQEVGSFDGDLITYQFSPDETTMLISRRHLGKKLSNEGALKLGARPENDTTRYKLFDIASQSTLKTFENIQTIDYTAEDNLIVQYDNETTKKITIQRSSSIFSRFMSPISEKTVDTQNISQKITYYDATKELSITLAHGKKITEANVMAYTLSPLKNYLVIQKEQTLHLLNMKTGKSNLITTNVITYEFSPDQKETRLVVLGAPREYFTGENTFYSLVDSEKPSASLTTFTVDNTCYFKSPHELIVINKNGTFASYNPQTGISYEREQQQKRKQITQEIHAKERAKEKEQKQLELEQLQQTEREEKEYLAQAEKRQEEINRQQQELQKYYEESVGIVQEPQQPSYFQQIKSYFWPTKNVTVPQPAQPITEEMATNNMKNIDDITKIITVLSQDNKDDRDNLLESYNAYDIATKKKFATYFFTKPAGVLQNSSTSQYTTGTKYSADITTDYLYISDKTTKKIIFTHKLPHDVKTMIFSIDDGYLALSYEDEKGIDIFVEQSNTFVLSRSLPLNDFGPIIGLKFITTEDYTYLFFIDTTYKMGIYDLGIKYYSIKSTAEQPILKRPK